MWNKWRMVRASNGMKELKGDDIKRRKKGREISILMEEQFNECIKWRCDCIITEIGVNY